MESSYRELYHAHLRRIDDPAVPQDRVYFGEIVAAYADEDAAQRLSKLAAGVLPVARP